ncbi:MAG: 4Fe-4S binding protein [Caldilinea sp.]
MAKSIAKRQQVRRGLLLVTMLLFPLIYYFLSPYLIIDAAVRGIVNGSFIMFALLFVSGLIVGRGWCGWVCPGAGLQEACSAAQNKPARSGRLDWIKWGIWIVWIGGIVTAIIFAGGYRAVEPLYPNNTWISIIEPAGFIVYYIVIGLIVLLGLVFGRRAFCHYGCWMAPFLILGRRVRNAFNLPALRLKAEPARCVGCNVCTRNCPMSLDVMALAKQGKLEHPECILCGTCVDVCAKNVLAYNFGREN